MVSSPDILELHDWMHYSQAHREKFLGLVPKSLNDVIKPPLKRRASLVESKLSSASIYSSRDF